MGRVRVAWYYVILTLARMVFALLGGRRVLHAERMPAKGGIIVAPVHLSNLDPPIVACATNRRLRFMAKEELFKVPVFGPLIRTVQAFPIRRGEGDTEAIRQAMKFIADGDALLVFPEGTRGDGKTIGAINRGATMLAKRTGAPVVPVGICGTHISLPKGASKPKRTRITVAIGEPFTFAEIAEKTPEGTDAREAFASELQKRLIELTEEAGLKLRTAPSNARSKSDPAPLSPNAGRG